MKNTNLLFLLIVIVPMALSSCEKDDIDKNTLQIDNQKYAINYSYRFDYGWQDDYWTTEGYYWNNFIFAENFTNNEPTGKYIYIEIHDYVPEPGGNYQISRNWADEPGIIFVEYGNYSYTMGTQVPSGSVSISKNSDRYMVSIDGTDTYGNRVSLSYDGKIIKY